MTLAQPAPIWNNAIDIVPRDTERFPLSKILAEAPLDSNWLLKRERRKLPSMQQKMSRLWQHMQTSPKHDAEPHEKSRNDCQEEIHKGLEKYNGPGKHKNNKRKFSQNPSLDLVR